MLWQMLAADVQILTQVGGNCLCGWLPTRRYEADSLHNMHSELLIRTNKVKQVEIFWGMLKWT